MSLHRGHEPGTSKGVDVLSVPGVRAGGDDRPPVPDRFGIALDPRARRIDGGAALVGGSPLMVLRLSPAGELVVDALVAGEPVPPGGAANRLARRLLDLGLAHPRPPAGHPGDAVTVVIPVRDDPGGLATTLAHLGPVGRVLVVDDGSDDPAALRRAVDGSPQGGRAELLRLDRARGPGGARQVGWEAATTDVVAFVDAGCRCDPGWIERLTAHLADPAVAAVAPRVRPHPSRAAPRWLEDYEEVRSPLDLGTSEAAVRPRSRVPYVPAATLVVRRKALRAVGGFEPALRFGEDVDLVWRLTAAGWGVRYEPAAGVAHDVRPTLGTLLRQRFDYGSSAAPLAARHGDAVAPLAVSSWSAASWALAALGHPILGAGLAAASTAGVVPRLGGLQHPEVEALRIAGAGHLRSGLLIAEACRRTWWPLLLAACLVSGRARRTALLAVVPLLFEPRPPASVLRLPTWLALRLADDLAYGLGVWAGAARARSTAALRPRLSRRPLRS